MRRLCQEDWLIEGLLVTSDLTEVLCTYIPGAIYFLMARPSLPILGGEESRA